MKTDKTLYIIGAFLMLANVARAQTTDSVAMAEPAPVDSMVLAESTHEAVLADNAQAQEADTAAVSESGYLLRRPERIKRALRFDRGLAFDTKTPAMPKGLFIVGMNISYSQHNNDQYSFLILNGLNSKGNTFSVSPMLHYVFANNQSIGVRFSYKRQNMEFGIAPEDLSISSEMLGMILDGDLRYKYSSHTYMGFVSYRYYVGFGQNMRRLLFFNEVQLGFGGGQMREDAGTGLNPDGTKVTIPGQDPLQPGSEVPFRRTTHQKSLNFRVGFSPGVTFFMTNSLAMEMQIGLLGYEYKKITQTSEEQNYKENTLTTDKKKGSRSSSAISSKFDFLSISFGMAFHI